ncbi:hypothetical protein CVT26_002827, partial [Gymnopilus dilepis]
REGGAAARSTACVGGSGVRQRQPQPQLVLTNELGAGGQPGITPARNSLSQLGDKPRGGGSGDSSGDDNHWAPDDRAATSGSLFDAREAGLVLAREPPWGRDRVPTIPPARLPERRWGGKVAAAALGWVVKVK